MGVYVTFSKQSALPGEAPQTKKLILQFEKK
jgi:hypothetical protein